ncbi:MAG TPA: DUF5666 domain-containing protein [Vicinamibacterales bacterium]
MVAAVTSSDDELATLLKGGNKGKGGNDSNEADKDNGNRGMLSGFVSAVNSDSIVIRGITVEITSDTVVRHGNRRLTIGNIQVGDHAQARGTMNGSTLVATEVKVEDTGRDNDDGEADEDDEDEAEGDDVEGTVSGLTGSCGSGLTFMIGTTKVTTNGSTTFSGGSCSAIMNLTKVEVEGTKGNDGTIAATKVELDLDDVDGTISGLSGTGTCPSVTFNIGTTKVTTSAATTFSGVTCAALANGTKVEVEGTTLADLSIAAALVKLD